MNVVFIGGGVAAFASALELIDNGFTANNITIIEQGHDIENRPLGALLIGCGGAGTCTDGKNVYSLFTDKPLQRHLSIPVIEELFKIHQRQVVRFHPDPSKISITHPNQDSEILKEKGIKACEISKPDWENELVIRDSTLYHTGSHYGKITAHNTEKHLRSMGVVFKILTKAIDVDFDRKVVITEPLGFIQEMEAREVPYDKLIICTGKASKKFIKSIMEKKNIHSRSTEMNLGVRFEIPYTDDVAKVVEHSYDFKFTKNYGNMNLRSFCVNNLSAKIEDEAYEVNGVIRKSVNGHAYGMSEEFKDKYTYTTNFGIICQKFLDTDQNDVDIVEDIVKKQNDKIWGYEQGTFKSGYTNYELTEMISKEHFLELYGDIGANIFDFINDLQKVLNFTEYRFFGPEYKLSSGNIFPNLKPKSMELKDIPGVYVAGDLTSAIGIVPAASAGISIAQDILKGL